jgi:RNA polymerase sigma-70 factor (ECF subfamily)
VTAADFLNTVQQALAPATVADVDAAMLRARIEGGWASIPTRFGAGAQAVLATLTPGFAAHVAAKLNAQGGLATALPRLRLDDLFIAYWAGQGDAVAIAAFERDFATVLDRVVARFHRLPADELRQRLRIKLFVAAPGDTARVLDYAGFGFLENWLKVTAARCFVDIARAMPAATDALDESEVLDLPASSDPKLAHLRAEIAAVVKVAFAAGVEALPDRARTYLRHVYVDKLTLDQIAALHHVHRATVARILAQARETLMAQTRTRMREQLRVEDDGLASAVAMIDSQFDLSLSRVLSPSSQPAPTGSAISPVPEAKPK